MTNEGLSLVDVAEIILKEAKEPLNIYDIFDAVCVRKGLAANVKDVVVSQFYADITVSAKFVYVGENTWDLKDNQKTELWEKDGSFYKEYTEIDVPEEYLEKEVKKVAKVVVKETPIVEEVIVEEPVVEEVIVEAVVETVLPVADKTPAVLDADSDDSSDEFEEELFEDDFDEEKYNEYMDTYEDKYEK